VYLRHLWLTDIRSYDQVDLELTDGLCAVLGPNGVGKTNLLESVAYLALLESFRGAPIEALVRAGAERGIIRGEVHEASREQLIECELRPTGRNRVLLNRQRLTRSTELLGALRVTIFSPDDLQLVKSGPSVRRTFLDRLVISLDPRRDAVRAEYDRALRQRNALLKQTKGRLDEGAALTLEVWDTKLVEAGERLGQHRVDVIEELLPLVSAAYRDVSGIQHDVRLEYEAPWREEGLSVALGRVRDEELRRGVTLVGPHRDEMAISLEGLPARTHASQGEQRCIALGLRLASHRLVHRVTGVPPVLLLDDVVSELDPDRSSALLGALPPGQTLLSSATGLPPGVAADQILVVRPGAIVVQ